MKHLPIEEKTLPISFERFIAAYHTNSNTEDSVKAYKIYLESNDWNHHYGDVCDNKESWLLIEVTKYLTN